MVVVGAAFTVRRWLVPLGTGNADEGAYLNLATLLRHGRVTVPGSNAPFFRPWLTGAHGDHFFFQYEPGWPALLALGDTLGSTTLASALAAVGVVASIHYLALEVTGDRRTAMVASILAACTPLFLLHSALALAYLFSTFLFTATLAVGIRAARLRSRGHALAVGLLLGVFLVTRPFDAVLTTLALIAGVYLLGLARESRTLMGLAGAATVGVIPFVAVAGWFNYRTTGSWTTFPLTASDPRNTFGFGKRGLQIGVPATRYFKEDATQALGTNLRAAVGWLPGGLVGLAVALAAFSQRPPRPRIWLAAMTALFPAAYFFWWATALSERSATNGLGPHYYMPSFVPLLVLIADGLVGLCRRHLALGVAVVLAGTVATAWNVPDKLDSARSVTSSFRRLDGAIPDDLDRSIVIVASEDMESFTSVDYPFLRNSPDLDDPVLFPADRHGEVALLLRQRPARDAYLAHREVIPGKDIFDQQWVLTPLTVDHGSTVRLRLGLAPPPRVTGEVSPFVTVDGRRAPVDLPDALSWTLSLTSRTAKVGDGTEPLVRLEPGVHDLRVGIEDARTGERWLRLYRVFVDRQGTVYVLRPGIGEHVTDLGRGPIAFPENVDAIVTERP